MWDLDQETGTQYRLRAEAFDAFKKKINDDRRLRMKEQSYWSDLARWFSECHDAMRYMYNDSWLSHRVEDLTKVDDKIRVFEWLMDQQID